MARGIFQFKAIPAKKINVGEVLWEVRRELIREGDIERQMLEKTTRTWKHPVAFQARMDLATNKAGVHVWTNDKIYGYVEGGTRPHIIRPRRARVLSFLSGYKAKTAPRVIGSRSGGASGRRVFSCLVHHPGTKARRFYEEVRSRRRSPFARNIQAAITRGLARAQR